MDNVRTVTIEPHESRAGHYCYLIIYRGDNVDPDRAGREKTKNYDNPHRAYMAARLRQIELMGASSG